MDSFVIELKVDGGAQSMSWLEFVSNSLGAIAWPLVALVGLVMFRKPIADLIDRVRKVSVAGQEFEAVPALLDDAEAKVRDAVVTDASPSPELKAPAENLEKLIELSPAAAVVQVWNDVEIQLMKLAGPHFALTNEGKFRPSIRSAAEALAEKKELPRWALGVLLDLYRLRNIAAHGGNISESEAVRFLAMADQVREAFASVRTSGGEGG